MEEDKNKHKMASEDQEAQENVSDQPSQDVQNDVDNDNMTDWEDKFNQIQDSYLRLNAEFDNYRKRTLKEKADLLKSGSERVLLDVISVVDDFERALSNVNTSQDVEAIKEGVNLIYDKFKNFLSKHGIKEVEAIGQPFDTDKHEAITTIPAASEGDKDKVVDCVQKGYSLDGKVIRYPKVIVAK